MNISANTNQIADSQAINRIFYNYAVNKQQNFQKTHEIQPQDTK